MIDELLETINTNLNQFPVKNSVSRTLGLGPIVLGTPKLDYNRLKLEFGAYVQTHIGTTNSMKTRSIAAIALRPSIGRRGYYFLSLQTGKQFHAMTWTELPISDFAIERFHQLTNQEGAPAFVNGL